MSEERLHRLTRVGLLASVAAGLGLLVGAEGAPQLVGLLLAGYAAAWLVYRLASKASAREWLVQALLVHVSLGLVLAAFEVPVALGLVDYRAIFRPPIAPMHDPQNQLDMQLLFRRRAHTHVKGVADGGDFGFLFHTEAEERIPFDARFDEDGFRNPDKPQSADIVFVGDSFTEALLVPTEDVVSSRLAARYGVRTANYGMMTYGPYQELEVVKRYAVPLEPKVVVWLFFEGNDLGDVTYYEWATKDLVGLHERYHGFLHRSFSMNLPRTLYHLTRAFKPSGEPRSAPLADDERTRFYFLHPPKSVTSPKNAAALEAFERLMAEAHAVTSGAGIQLVVAFIPVKLRVYEGLLEVDPESDVASWALTDLPEHIERIVRKTSSDILYVDLLEPLRAAATEGRHPYYRIDSHWNAMGHQVAAESLSAAIGALPSADGETTEN